MKNKYIYSCILGGTFFAIPYLACGISAIPAAAIGIAAYGAGILIFNDKSKIDISDNIEESDKEALKKAKELIEKMKTISTKLEEIFAIHQIKL